MLHTETGSLWQSAIKAESCDLLTENTWTPVASPKTNGLITVAFGAGSLSPRIPVGEIITSVDGEVWKTQTTDMPNASAGLTRTLRNLKFGSGRFVGLTWDQTSSPALSFDPVMYKLNLLVNIVRPGDVRNNHQGRL
jgi:hypothetical protein